MLGRPAADRGGALSIRRNSTSCSWRVLASPQDNDNPLSNQSEIAHVRSCPDVGPEDPAAGGGRRAGQPDAVGPCRGRRHRVARCLDCRRSRDRAGRRDRERPQQRCAEDPPGADLGRHSRGRPHRGSQRRAELGTARSAAGHPAHRDPHGRRVGQADLPRLQRRGLHQRHQGADRRHPEQCQQRQPALHRHGVPAGHRQHRGGARHQ